MKTPLRKVVLFSYFDYEPITVIQMDAWAVNIARRFAFNSPEAAYAALVRAMETAEAKAP